MHRKINLLFLLFVISAMSLVANKTPDQIQKEQIRDQMLFNSAQGREFYIAIPGNESPDYPTQLLEIYVTTSKLTKATIESPTMGVYITKEVRPLQITTFSSSTGETSFQWELWTSEKKSDKGLRIFADQPISVYVLNAKQYTSEGYLAIPLSAWGNEYIHCSYYDHNEIRPWKSGFVVISSEKQTKIRIELRGRGWAHTAGGRSLGAIINETLDQGQVYMVTGDGTTRGEFDLTGSKIVANKPIGLISFHQRTHIPSYDIWNGRDHLVEMLPPVHAWGKKYVTVEYKRDSDQGDYFRIVASEPNTHYDCKYYDKSTGDLLGRWEGYLKDAGDFEEWLQEYVQAGNKLKSIRGTSVFEADKPVLVMQYSYSADWDGNDIFDPFMIIVVPVEQYIPATVFQTPSGKAFIDNWFNIIAEHNPADSTFNDLKSLEVDKQKVWVLEPSFLFNKIPTTNLYWAKLRMEPGAHKIIGDTKFGGYIYGFSEFDSYGWPAAMAINKLDETDTLPPEIYPDVVCGEWTVPTTELRNGGPNDDPRQVDQGISDVRLLDGSYNYDLELPDFKVYPPTYEYEFYLHVMDKYRSALGIYSIIDRAGNVTIDTASYSPDSLLVDPDVIDFGDVRLNTPKEITATVTNVSDSAFKITKIELKTGQFYTILDGAAPPEFEIQPGEVHDVKIQYIPLEESKDLEDLDIDSLIIETDCLDYIFPIKGRGVIPKIWVADFHAGDISVGSTKCISEQGKGLEIRNMGSMPLTVTGVDMNYVVPPFSISDPSTPPFPFTIDPGKSVWLVDVCFTAPDTADYQIFVPFISDGVPIKDTSEWTGAGLTPGPEITGKNWMERRVGTVHDSIVKMRNVGNTPVIVTDVNLENTDPNFEIIKSNISPQLPVSLETQDAPSGTKEIIIPVRFKPVDEGQKEVKIIADIDDDNIQPGSVFNYLRGIGIIPKIEPIEWEFPGEILVGDTHPDTGYVEIKDTSRTEDLVIYNVKWENPAQQEFTFLDDFNKIFPDTIPMGKSIKLRVIFHPTKPDPDIRENVLIEHNAGPGEGPWPDAKTYVLGHSTRLGVELDSLDFGERLTCNAPELKTTLYNQSVKDYVITSFLTTGDDAAFDVLTSLPQPLAAGKNLDIQIRFHPTAKVAYKMMLAAVYEYEFNGETVVDTTEFRAIKGIGYKVPFELVIDDMGDKSPSNAVLFPIKLKNPIPGDAMVDEFRISFEYPSRWMKFIEVRNPEVAMTDKNRWDLKGTETPDLSTGMTKLTIYGRALQVGDYVHGGSGTVRFFDLKMQLLLSDTVDYRLEVTDDNIDLIGRNACVERTGDYGDIHLAGCVIDLRAVFTSPDQYMLSDVNPNPVKDHSFNLNYSVGLKGHTTIELYNANSDLIDVIVDTELDHGNYQNEVSTENLSSGVYFIKMISGPFKDVKRLVINK